MPAKDTMLAFETIIKQKGLSKNISMGGGGFRRLAPENDPMIVTAAASVPSSFASMMAL